MFAFIIEGTCSCPQSCTSGLLPIQAKKRRLTQPGLAVPISTPAGGAAVLGTGAGVLIGCGQKEVQGGGGKGEHVARAVAGAHAEDQAS